MLAEQYLLFDDVVLLLLSSRVKKTGFVPIATVMDLN